MQLDQPNPVAIISPVYDDAIWTSMIYTSFFANILFLLAGKIDSRRSLILFNMTFQIWMGVQKN